jgi:ADP-L-glycero-D-manno-heptose 6-epimerase
LEYIPFPDDLKAAYQSHTQADLSRLRDVGHSEPFAAVREGVARYLDWLNA